MDFEDEKFILIGGKYPQAINCECLPMGLPERPLRKNTTSTYACFETSMLAL